MAFVDENPQSRFTNLLECFNDWTLTILCREHQIVLYIDFAKAFDVVSHPKLIARLYFYGICGMHSVTYVGYNFFVWAYSCHSD